MSVGCGKVRRVHALRSLPWLIRRVTLSVGCPCWPKISQAEADGAGRETQVDVQLVEHGAAPIRFGHRVPPSISAWHPSGGFPTEPAADSACPATTGLDLAQGRRVRPGRKHVLRRRLDRRHGRAGRTPRLAPGPALASRPRSVDAGQVAPMACGLSGRTRPPNQERVMVRPIRVVALPELPAAAPARPGSPHPALPLPDGAWPDGRLAP